MYNLQTADAGSRYEVSYQILNSDFTLNRSFPVKIKQRHNSRAMEVGAVNLTTFDDAAYFLRIGIKDLIAGDSVSVCRGFWHKTKEPVPVHHLAENPVVSALKQMSDAEMDTHFRQLKYIMPTSQIKLYQKLNAAGKLNFLINFWQGLDPDLTTDENEFWGEFQKRLEYANQHYTAGFTDGWKTDCGRILIRYGIPGDIVRRDVRGNAKPYQEWFYNRDGGFRFIFVDEEGLGRYRLVYSSRETEYTDPNWKLLVN